MNVLEMIKKHEGFRAKKYKDTLGNSTIGYGINLETEEIPEEVADLWMKLKVGELRGQLKRHSWFNNLDEIRKGVILDAAYNLGYNGLLKFKNMIAALENQKYDEAAKELLDSKAARQTGNRYTELAAILAEDENMGI